MELRNNIERTKSILLAFRALRISLVGAMVLEVISVFMSWGAIVQDISLIVTTIQQLLFYSNIGLTSVATVLFLRWFYRAYENAIIIALDEKIYRQHLYQQGLGLQFELNDAFWAWFIPIINLKRPKLILLEMWRIYKIPTSITGIDEGTGGIIKRWWTCCLIAVGTIVIVNGVSNFFDTTLVQSGVLICYLLLLKALRYIILIIKNIAESEGFFTEIGSEHNFHPFYN